MKNSIKILVADDEAIGRQLLEAILLPEGYSIVFSTNGQEALDAAFNEHPDIILLDVMMPKLDGFEVCKKIRENSKTAHIPVYLISALDDRDSRIRGIDAGADDYISKPFDRFEIVGKLKNRINILKNHKKFSVASFQNPKTDPGNDSFSRLLRMLCIRLLPEPVNTENIWISGTCSSFESQHAIIKDNANGKLNYLLVSNKLKPYDSVLANCMVSDTWKNALYHPKTSSGNPFQDCILDLNNLIIDENLDSLKSAGFSMVSIIHRQENGEILVSGLNQNIILYVPDNALHPGLVSGYQLLALKGSQELRFSHPAKLLLLSPDLYEDTDLTKLIQYMNDQLKNLPDARVVEQLQKKFSNRKDVLIVLLTI
jgi:CheY-like chemotaxis protein